MKGVNKIFVVILVILLLVLVNNNVSKSIQLIVDIEEDLTFAVLSDIHTNTNKFTNAINDLYIINPKIDALVLNGDIVDQGLDEQYDKMKNSINENKDKLPNNIIMNIGNHELYNYSEKVKDKSEIDIRFNKYLNFSGNENTYNDKWINGYHFISLGTDSVDIKSINNNISIISNDQIKWLDKKLKEGYKKGKPIFVFIHQPLTMKFFNEEKVVSNKSKEIKNILCKYPEVILFTSHTHITPDDSFDSKIPFKVVNTGSVSYNYIDDNCEKGYKVDHNLSNGIYVEVSGNEVLIMGRDFINNRWIYK